MTSFSQIYDNNQDETDIIIPSSGKKIFIYFMKLETTEQGGAKLIFSSKTGTGASGIEQIVPILEIYSSNIGYAESNTGISGVTDEPLKLKCTAGTKVIILYEEI